MTVRHYLLLIIGIAALAVGGILYFWPQPTSFGWTAYAPLSATAFVSDLSSVTRALGTAALLIGTALTAGWIGHFLGRRRNQP